MHPKIATLMLLSGGALLLSGCESDNPGTTTAPPPSPYETVVPPIIQTTPPGNQPVAPANPGMAATAPAPNAPLAPILTPKPPRARVVEHTVDKGESLWSISRKYETTVDEIRQANQLTGDMIRSGQTLKIPTSMPEGDPFPSAAPPALPSGLSSQNESLPPSLGSARPAASSNWTVTPPIAPPTSSGSSAPQYRIPEPVILPPPGGN